MQHWDGKRFFTARCCSAVHLCKTTFTRNHNESAPMPLPSRAQVSDVYPFA